MRSLVNTKDSNNSIAVEQILAALLNLPAGDYDTLAHHKSPLVRINVAGNPNLAAETIELLAQDSDARVRAVLARNTKAMSQSGEKLAALARDPDTLVREALAANPQAKPAVLALLAQDISVTVQTSLANNPALPPETLLALANSDCNAVRNALIARGDLGADA